MIRCQGEVSFDNGRLHGRQVLVFSSTISGNWYLHVGNRLIEAGLNLSHDEGHLKLNRYQYSALDGVRAHYDWKTHRLTFRFKYDEGSLGGGRRWTSGTFENCEEFQDELPVRPHGTCAQELSFDFAYLDLSR